jgi:hypothetical protein
MKPNMRFALQRLFLGWALFFTGWLLILWLHTFNDRVPHRMIGPLLLWITLTVCLWDGCRIFAIPLRAFLFVLQVATGVAVSTVIVLHILNHAA